MLHIKFAESLYAELRKQMDVYVHRITTGGVNDMSQYSRILGRIEAFREIETIAKRVYKECTDGPVEIKEGHKKFY
jgi:hypothetical protein